MNEGWIKLYRSIQDDPLWNAESFSKAQAWIDLFLNANHKPNIFFIRGVEVTVDRGQLAWSELTMSKRWGWSTKKVRNFLSYLERNNRIHNKKSNLTTIVTICNYDEFQSSELNQYNTKVITKYITKDQQTKSQKNSKLHTNNNVKNDKNEKNNSPPISPKKEKSSEIINSKQHEAIHETTKQNNKGIRLDEWYERKGFEGLPEKWRDYTKQNFNWDDDTINGIAKEFWLYWTSDDAKQPYKRNWFQTWQRWVAKEDNRGVRKTFRNISSREKLSERIDTFSNLVDRLYEEERIDNQT